MLAADPAASVQACFDKYAVTDAACEEPYVQPQLLPLALEELHLIAPAARIGEFLADVDAAHNGCVTLPLFDAFCDELRSTAPSVEALVEAFNALDTDGSGFLEPGEFVAAMCSGDGGMTRQEALAVLTEFDHDGNGKIDADEFIRVVWRMQGLEGAPPSASASPARDASSSPARGEASAGRQGNGASSASKKGDAAAGDDDRASKNEDATPAADGQSTPAAAETSAKREDEKKTDKEKKGGCCVIS
jgi:Ca2+-binding EF-hand superfamily protein